MTDTIVQQDTTDRPDSGSLSSAAMNEMDAKLVPVAEAKRYRKRAQAAEQELEAARQDLAVKEKLVHEQAETIASLERRERIDSLLRDSEAIDIETTRLLTELAVLEMDEPDVERAVAELRERKPHLFRSSGLARPAAQGARRDAEPHERRIAEAAEAASTTGRRSDLLRYLRLKRGTS